MSDPSQDKRPHDGAEEMAGSAAKRPRTDGSVTTSLTSRPLDVPQPVSRLGLKPQLPVLPASLEAVTGKKADLAARLGFVGEPEVGIMGYLGDNDFPGVHGVFKQRFTDFLVNEISLKGDIIHLKDIGKPEEPQVEKPISAVPSAGNVAACEEGHQEPAGLPSELQFRDHPLWPSAATAPLRLHLSDETIIALHSLLMEGRNPKPKQDAGWGARPSQPLQAPSEEEMAMNLEPTGEGQNSGSWPPADKREVLSQVIEDKEARTAAHRTIRELLNGAFETSSRDVPNEGQRLVIRWAHKRGGRQQSKTRSKLPPYIHFTLHKSNRETMDCLGHISRLLNVHSKDLSVCGTKDKRAVTVQRVSLKRGNMTAQQVWKSVNGVKAGRRSEEEATTERGQRGSRVGDMTYEIAPLDLGMLKGNHFTIVLRNVQEVDPTAVDAAMASVRDRGFINFYGMQRFGTSTVPTHVTGLCLLKQQWGQAIDSILSLREGEHPDCTRARLAWLEDQDITKALEIMPRRAVAERAIWEHWKKGNRMEDKLGALNNIPRNLRSMYVHAYQSYIWNLVVSERIKLSNTLALPGDLVYADDLDDDEDLDNGKKPQAAVTREVKELTADNAHCYRLADVVMPLPGWHVEYPGGAIAELYSKILSADGLDPYRMRRDQREYSLPGSYRKIIHQPSDVSWEHIRYTDTDLPLSQSDEDRVLGLNSPVPNDPHGKFRALKISWSLGKSSYATMALREITRQETSTWHQIGLTQGGEDQVHKGSGQKRQEGTHL